MKIKHHQRDANRSYSSRLEVGDYVPYFMIDNDGHKLDMQVKACRYNLLLIIDHAREDIVDDAVNSRTNYQQFTITDEETEIIHPDLFHNKNVYRLFSTPDAVVTACICDPNLKICYINHSNSLTDLTENLPEVSELPVTGAPPPVLVVPNVISQDLSQRLIHYLDDNRERVHQDSSDYKTRAHIHPDSLLEQELDDKLSKSLLPEIEKVFYSDISHRETYKICHYGADDRGCFGKHRDTIDPHLHRRYALTLVLNDDFEGGGICFPEYSDEVMNIPKNWAIVFPGSLFHQVNTIGVGNRYVVVSFLFSEAEAKVKEGSERYRFKVDRDLCGLDVNQLTPIQEPSN